MELVIKNKQLLLRTIKERPKKVVDALNVGLRKGLRNFEGELQRRQLSGRKGAKYGLKRVSGTAAMSLSVNTRVIGADVEGSIMVGKSAWYLKVHQHYKFNGYIRPKNAMYLTIPIARSAVGRRARDFDGLFVIKIPGRDPLLVRKKGKKGIELMYALKKQVYVPKRLYFYESFKTKGIKFIKRHIEREINSIK